MVNIGLIIPMFEHLWPCICYQRYNHPRTESMNMNEWEWQFSMTISKTEISTCWNFFSIVDTIRGLNIR